MIQRNFFRLLFAPILFVASLSAYGQQEPNFTHYMFNSQFLNPGSVGLEGISTAMVLHRSQYLGYNASFDDAGSVNSQVVAFNTPLYKANSGVGLHIVHDKIFLLRNIQVQGSYSYHLPLGPGKLGIGARVGIYTQSLDFDRVRVLDKDDPVVQTGVSSQIKPDAAVGLWYRARKYYGGVSFTNVLKSTFDYGISAPASGVGRVPKSSLANHMYITGGYNIDVTPNLVVTPSFIYKTDLNTRSIEVSAIALYNEKMWGGLNFREGDAVCFLIGSSLLDDNSLKVGLGFDYVSFNTSAKSSASIELYVSYVLPITAPGSRPIIRTPRFRHQ